MQGFLISEVIKDLRLALPATAKQGSFSDRVYLSLTLPADIINNAMARSGFLSLLAAASNMVHSYFPDDAELEYEQVLGQNVRIVVTDVTPEMRERRGNCRSAVIAFLRLQRIPNRDMMGFVAHLIWNTRRHECWPPHNIGPKKRMVMVGISGE